MPPLVRWLRSLFTTRLSSPPPRAPPRAPLDSNVVTAEWFDAATEPRRAPEDPERYRAAPPLGRDSIDSDPATAVWFKKPRSCGPAAHSQSRALWP